MYENVGKTYFVSSVLLLHGKQVLCSVKSTLLPPMWPGFKSQRLRHMWVEFVVGSLPSPRGFPPGTPVCPSSQKIYFNARYLPILDYSFFPRDIKFPAVPIR